MRDVLIVPPKHSWLVTGLLPPRFRHFGALFRFFERRSQPVYSESFFLQTSASLCISLETTTGTQLHRNDKVKSVHASFFPFRRPF